MKLLCKKDCYFWEEEGGLCFKNGVNYDVLSECQGEYKLIDETGEEHTVLNKIGDMFLDDNFTIID